MEGTALAYVGGAVLGKAFEVGGRVVYSLKEALHIVRASTPAMGQEMSQVVIQLEQSAPQIEKLVIGKVNPGGIAAFKPAPKATKEVRFEGKKDVRPMLPGEGKVEAFGVLKKTDVAGDGLAAHHMPNDQYMRTRGISRGDGVAMLVEHPTPGAGGRHREIHKELIRQDPALAPRDALAESVARARQVYRADGVLPEARPNLLNVIEMNKTKFPDLFKKAGTE